MPRGNDDLPLSEYQITAIKELSMDPLSIAAAVLAVSQAVGSVSQALYTFITSAKGHPAADSPLWQSPVGLWGRTYHLG